MVIYVVDMSQRFALDIRSLWMCSVYGGLEGCSIMIPRYRTYRMCYEFCDDPLQSTHVQYDLASK